MRILSYYVTTLSRLCLHHKDFFIQFFQQLSQEVIPQQNLLYLYLHGITEKLDHLTEQLRKKVVVFSLLTLMKEPSLLSNVELMNGCFAFTVMAAIDLSFLETNTTDDPSFIVIPETDEFEDQELYITEVKLLNQENKTEKDWRKVYKVDPLHQISSKDFFWQTLAHLQQNSPDLFNQLLSQVPQELLLKFQLLFV